MKLRGLLLLCLLIPALAMGQALVTARGSGAVTWSLIQHPNNSCIWSSGTTFACAVTVSSTTVGDALIAVWSVVSGGLSAGPTVSSVSGDGSWTHCTSCYGYSGTSAALQTVDADYILSATGGATTITVTVNTPGGTTSVVLQPEIIEVRRSTGTSTFDTANFTPYNSGCTTNCAAPTLTVTGTDYVFTWGSFGGGAPTLPGASYTDPADTLFGNAYSGYAGALNVSSFSAAVWQQGVNQYATVAVGAIK